MKIISNNLPKENNYYCETEPCTQTEKTQKKTVSKLQSSEKPLFFKDSSSGKTQASKVNQN